MCTWAHNAGADLQHDRCGSAPRVHRLQPARLEQRALWRETRAWSSAGVQPESSLPVPGGDGPALRPSGHSHLGQRPVRELDCSSFLVFQTRYRISNHTRALGHPKRLQTPGARLRHLDVALGLLARDPLALCGRSSGSFLNCHELGDGFRRQLQGLDVERIRRLRLVPITPPVRSTWPGAAQPGR